MLHDRARPSGTIAQFPKALPLFKQWYDLIMSQQQSARVYSYVGPHEIAKRVAQGTSGFAIHSPADVTAWIKQSGQVLVADSIVATFIVDLDGVMRIADRRSEHVACADGNTVLSAGEITFMLGETVAATEISNQSTGYCPEPESWPAVAIALAKAGLNGPGRFTLACEFRRCNSCNSITLIKDDLFKCGICKAALPSAYNVQPVHWDSA